MVAAAFATCENQYIAQHDAGIQLRDKLLQCFGMHPSFYTFAKTQEGKPYAVDAPFHFSISHSGTLCCCAISANLPFSKQVQEISLNMELSPCTPGPASWSWTDGILLLPDISGNIGVDIERVDFDANLDRLSKIIKRYLHEADPPSNAADFYQSWTRREALGKFTGEGFFTKVPSHDVCLLSFQLKLQEQIYFLSMAYSP